MILKYQGGLDKQKNVGGVGVLNATLGRYWENTGFLITIKGFTKASKCGAKFRLAKFDSFHTKFDV